MVIYFFVYFYKSTKNFFLVHGEKEGQDELKQKIEQTTGIPVTIPAFGESYALTETPQLLEREEQIVNYDQVFLRLDVLERMEQLKEQIDGIENVVKKDINTNDLDILHLNRRIESIQEQIENLMK